MKAQLKRLVYSLVLAASVTGLLAQQYHFSGFSMEEGLKHSSVFTALQDNRGEMWFGTDGGGVCRFNGADFLYFDTGNGLSGNIVRVMYEDSRGSIWIGTDKGLDRYNGFGLEHVAEEEICETTVLAINEDDAGRIWIGTRTRGLFCLEEADSLTVRQYTQDEGLLSAFVFDIEIDAQQRIWLSMVGGITILEYQNGEVTARKLIEDRDLPANMITCSSTGPGGDLWFGTYGKGVIRIGRPGSLDELRIEQPLFLSFLEEESVWDICWQSGNGMIATESKGVVMISEEELTDILDKDKGLKTNQVVGITVDDQGGTWFCTMGNGILRYTNQRFTRYDAPSVLEDNQVNAICEGSPGEFFLGSDEGLTRFNYGETGLLRQGHFNKESGLLDDRVSALFYREGRLWIGTNKGVNLLSGGRIRPAGFNEALSSRKINSILEDRSGNLWIGTDYGYNLWRDGTIYTFNEDNEFINNEVQTIIEDRQGDIWMGTLGGLVRLQDTQYTDYVEVDGLEETRINALAEDSEGNIWIGTYGGGIYYFDRKSETTPIHLVAGEEMLSSRIIYSLAFLNDSVLVAGTANGLEHLVTGKGGEIRRVFGFGVKDGFMGGKGNLNALWTGGESGMAFMGTSEGLIRYIPGSFSGLLRRPNVGIQGLKMFFEEQDWAARKEMIAWTGLPAELVLSHDEDHLTFAWTSAYYGASGDLEYSYFLDGQSRDWSPYFSGREAVFSGLRPGKYVFRVKVRNKYGVEGNTSEYAFEIKPPFWERPVFIAGMIVLLVILLYLAMLLRTRKLQKEKEKLESTVKERTHEVVEQKEVLQKQHNILEKQNNEIESSIHYAKRIQKAVIPSTVALGQAFPDSFVLLLPQQIVSGDFYWVSRQGEHVIVVAADCTGHGVPGALMSMMGIGFLNQIVNEENEVNPGLILNKLRNHIISAFTRVEGVEGDTRDGMDVALISYNTVSRKMYFAGAYNPLYLIRKGADSPELISHDPDRMPVGLHDHMSDFTTREIDYQEGDRLYMFSDGFPDQFGGPDFRKYMKKRFRKMLTEHSHLPMSEQKEKYTTVLADWMSHKDPDGEALHQTDDILVIGISL